MKKVFTILTSLIIFCLTTHAQIGLLSSNNKSDNSNQNVKSLPALSFTKGPGNYEKLSDSFQIKLKFDTALNNPNAIVSNLSEFTSDFVIKKANIDLLDLSTASLQNKIEAIQKKINTPNNNNLRELKVLNDSLNNVKAMLQKVSTEKQKAEQDLKNKTNELALAINLNKDIINELTTIKYKTFHDFLNKLESTNKKTSGSLYGNKYKINSYWFLIDSSKEKVDKTKFLDSLTMVYQQISLESDDNADEKKSIRETLKKLEDFNDTLNSVRISSLDDYTKLKDTWTKFASDTQNLNRIQNAINDSTESTVHFYESLLKNNIKDKVTQKDVETKEFGAFPQLTSILGKKEVIPTLQLYGSYNQQNAAQSFEANLGISFAATSAPDTANIYTIFIPTASKFLVHSNFTWSFLPVGTKQSDSTVKKIGLRLDVSFASKNLLYDTIKTNKTITSSFLYAKAGIELGIIPKRLSIYSNVNTATVLDQVDEFQNGTGVKSKFLGYIDCGAKLYFDPAPTAKLGEGLFIYSNLNFIINSGDVKRVTKSNDTVIPSIQVGLVKSLGKF